MFTPRIFNNITKSKVKNLSKNIIRTIVFSAILGFGVSVTAGELKASVTVSPVGDFEAEMNGFDGKAYVNGDKYSAEKFVIPWSSFSSGMGLRDKHTLKYVNADKYPNIEVVSAIGKAGKGAAKIKMNNIEKIIKGSYSIQGSSLIAEFSIILSEFDIKDISFKGAGVKDEVKVKMTVPVVAQAGPDAKPKPKSK